VVIVAGEHDDITGDPEPLAEGFPTARRSSSTTPTT